MTDYQVNFYLATADSDLKQIAAIAAPIWQDHFVPIIGQAQCDYMIEKFQSYGAIKDQVANQGYQYYQIVCDGTLCGYFGIRPDGNKLFLSKLYIQKDYRGRHLATAALRFMDALCIQNDWNCIWLTCNKYNASTLAVYDHLGFKITDVQVADIGNGFVMDDYILTFTV